MKRYNKFRYEQIMRNISHGVKKALNENMNADDVYQFIKKHNITHLYHATASSYIRSIKKLGLGGKVPKRRFWDYNGTVYEQQAQGVFLAQDEYQAESFLEASDEFNDYCDWYEERYDNEVEIVVFEIPIECLDLNLLSIDTNLNANSDDELTFFYNGVIPYSDIKRLNLY